MRSVFEQEIKSIEIFTKPNQFGNKYKVADIYLMNVADWINLKGSYLYDIFKELVLYLRPGIKNQLELEFELGYN